MDLGLYYRAATPIDVAAVRDVARAVNDTPDPVVTQIGGWGPWVNGGAWLTIGGRRTDFLYRDLDFVAETVEECLAGRGRADYWQQPPYGFHSQIYCAEIRCCVPLHDPEGAIAELKQQVAVYPEAMKRGRVSWGLWSSGFTLDNVKHAPERGEAYLVAGYLTRATTELIHALYALNEIFFMNDKYVYREVAEFAVAPPGVMERVEAIVSGGRSPAALRKRVDDARTLRAEILTLAGDLYTPRF